MADALEGLKGSASSTVLWRGGGGGGGPGFRPGTASFPRPVWFGTQSGSSSGLNGFDLRWIFAIYLSLGGCMVVLTGAPIAY